MSRVPRLAVSAVCAWLALRNVTLDATLAVLSTAQAWPWLPLALVAWLAAMVLRASRLRLLMPAGTSGSAASLDASVLGEFLRVAAPGPAFTAVPLACLSESDDTPPGVSSGIAQFDRLLAAWNAAFVTVLALSVLAYAGNGTTLAGLLGLACALASAALALATAGMLALAGEPAQLAAVAARIAAVSSPHRYAPTWQAVVSASTVAHGYRSVVQVLAITAGAQLLQACAFASLFSMLSLPAAGASLLAMAVVHLAALAPAVAGMIGTADLLCSGALRLLDLPASVAITFTGIAHVALVGTTLAWGAAVARRRGLTGAILRRHTVTPTVQTIAGVPMIVHGDVRGSTAVSRPRPFIASLCDTFVTGARTEVGPAHDDDDLLPEVTDFVHRQIEAMPWTLRTLVGIGLLGFRGTVGLRYFRGFCQLPADTRLRAVNAWSYGPVIPARQLFRGLRSLAYVAYFEYRATRSAKSQPARPS